MTCMKAQRSSKFCQIGSPRAELGALERLQQSRYTYNREKGVATFFSAVFDRIFLILTGNSDIHKSL